VGNDADVANHLHVSIFLLFTHPYNSFNDRDCLWAQK